MKKLATAIAVAALIGTPAFAADMPLKAPPPAPAPQFNWTGFYVGINGGYGSTGQSQITVSDPFYALGPGFGTGAPTTSVLDQSAQGGLGGFHAGYNWQFAPTWLVGVEGDWDWADIRDSATRNPVYLADPRSNITTNFKIDELASVRGRAGYVFPNNGVVYITGGAAWSRAEASGDMSCDPGACGNPVHAPSGNLTDNQWGWVFGSGFDILLPQTNWLFGFDWLHYHFNGGNAVTVPTQLLPGGTPPAFTNCPNGGACVGYQVGSYDINTFRLRLSYKF